MSTIQYQASATELARNPAKLIDRVRTSGKRIAITRGNREVAQLAPPHPEGASASAIKALLRKNLLGAGEKRTFRQDLDALREAASLPSSPWES